MIRLVERIFSVSMTAGEYAWIIGNIGRLFFKVILFSVELISKSILLI